MADYSELKRRAALATDKEGMLNYFYAATPEVVLALIAENDRLKSLRSKTESELKQELETWRNGPFCWTCGDTGDVHDMVGEWRGQCDCLAAQLINVSHERDQLKAELEHTGHDHDLLRNEYDQLKAEVEALRKQFDGMVAVPAKPSPGLLMSMAMRSDHGLGCPGYYDQPFLRRMAGAVSHARRLKCALDEMRKLHEEVVGAGFYASVKEADYAAMSKEAGHD